MCGIIGYIGNKANASDVLISGLNKLQYRGYDSCGIALGVTSPYSWKKEVKVFRFVGPPEKLANKEYPKSWCGIGHTRWATHGPVTEKNAHPHTSQDGEVTIVHNGVVENLEEVKCFLRDSGVELYGDTDSEALANLISLKGLEDGLGMVRGPFALAILFSSKPDKIFCIRRSSPLLIGLGEEDFFISSDVNALPLDVKRVVHLDDDRAVCVTHGGISEELEFTVVHRDSSVSEVGSFSCYMEKEIFEQPKSIENSISGRFNLDSTNIKFGGVNLDTRINEHELSRVLFLGCGTAYHAGLLGKYFMQEIAGICADAEFSSEYKYRKVPIEQGTLAVAISQSGETADTLSATKEIKPKALKTIAITNGVSSPISREVDEGVYQRVGSEVSVASTKAFTSQATLVLMLSILFGRRKGMSGHEASKYIAQIKRIPELVEELLSNSASLKGIAESCKNSSAIDFLGRGYFYPIALEGSLKLKELSYMSSHAYPSGEMKHGPLATVDKDKVYVFIAPQETLKEKNISNMLEIKAREGKIFLIKQEGQDFPEDSYDFCFNIPDSQKYIQPILSVIPLQLFSMYIAQLKGYNIDRPRNLAKSVTVE